ncbi:PorP/SprF family type IX secretion system membrane protein [Paracrocinitomix mangrovi]|uniref:PorP/SprF family type IX secretion system membrane protein n=1 Tax=Paracrocinitomix mangrovi TaxID=2862509 RepID=UPI001C8D84DE|nr:PorP/SprF family type IX secretion system membrane protein [Paracrocinitomix mangrovi]UKN01118.1 PorP/SprF family type IX secretion system membrane protein [Paracrocinitomix mangrovi]
MKKILYILFLLIVHQGFAQNRVNYSQYMHNHQIFNPAYTSEDKELGASALYRNQWMGIKGAPSSFIGNFYVSTGRSKFDAQFLYDRITIFSHLEAGLSYSYTIKLGVATRMSFGIKATYNQQTYDYNQLHYFDGGDPNLIGVVKTQGVNFGTGLFFRHGDWHAGLGAPYLFANRNLNSASELYNDVSYQHFYITGGYKVINNRSMTFYPTSMIKWTAGAPVSLSVDANFLFNNLIWGSVGYKTGNTIVLSTGVLLWKNFKIIYSYDLSLGKVSKYGGMTHEISMGYGMDLFSKNSFVKRKFVTRKGGRMRNKRRNWR